MINIKLINPSENKFGHFEYDFFPDRSFDSEKYAILWPDECWENEKYLHFFMENDAQNIKVICFCTYNNIPIMSSICHKFIAFKCDFSFFNTGHISRSGFNWRDIFDIYSLDWRTMFNMQNRSQRVSYSKYFDLWESSNLANKFLNSNIYIDEQAFIKFNNDKDKFEKNKIYVIYKKRSYYYLFEKIKNEKLDSNIYPHDFNENLLKISGPDNYCSYQILLSLFNKFGVIALGGSASFASLCLPMNTIFLSDFQWNVREFIITMKSQYNQGLYGIPSNGFVHYERHVIKDGWRFECLKESILNFDKTILPEVNIINEK